MERKKVLNDVPIYKYIPLDKIKHIGSQVESMLASRKTNIQNHMEKYDAERDRIIDREKLIDLNLYKQAKKYSTSTNADMRALAQIGSGALDFRRREEYLEMFERLRIQNETLEHTLQFLLKSFKEITE